MGDITLRKALGDYRTIYMPYRNFAERTREEYSNDLEDFVGFVEISGISKVGELGLPIIQRYAAHLEERGLSSLTRKRKVVAIRSLLLFLYQDEYIQTNLSAKIAVPFAGTTRPHVLTSGECERLRQACASDPRDAAIIEVLLQTGIRLSELTALTLNDIDWADVKDAAGALGGYVRIVGGRGRKERMIPLDFAACVRLRKYLSTRIQTDRATLFLNRFGNPLGERGVQKIIRKYMDEVGIRQASVHSLRHAFAMHYVKRGAKRADLRDALGCRDNRTVDVYFDLTQPKAV